MGASAQLRRTLRTRATMKDVAALAGVSLKTVSRVVNGEGGVTPAKVAVVQRAVAQLDYRPDLGASNLRRADRKTSTIGVLLEDLGNPFSAVLHRAIEDVARSRHSLVLAASVDEDPDRERETVRAFSMRRTDALIIAPAADDQSYLYADVRAGTPVAFVDRPPRGLLADAVLSDNREAATTAVRHLASVGHRRIAFLGDDLTIATASERLAGYRQACAELGVRPSPGHVAHGLHTVEAAAEATTRMLLAEDAPTALFTSQNLVTIGAIAALQQFAREQTVALVGLDDFPAADLLRPRVSVVAQDPAEIGRVAAALVFRRLDGEEWPATTHVVPTRLVRRGSGEIPPPVPG